MCGHHSVLSEMARFIWPEEEVRAEVTSFFINNNVELREQIVLSPDLTWRSVEIQENL